MECRGYAGVRTTWAESLPFEKEGGMFERATTIENQYSPGETPAE